MAPNGVFNPSPPAKGSPPSRKWHDMQSPAATRYSTRRSCAALGVESSMRLARRPLGVIAELGYAGNAGEAGIWLSAKATTPRPNAAPVIRTAVRGRENRFIGLPSHQRAGSLQVLRLDCIGGKVRERGKRRGGVITGVLRESSRAH